MTDWYSVDSYFLAKTILDLIPSVGIIIVVIPILNIAYERNDMWGTMYLSFGLSFLFSQSIGHIIGICFDRNPTFATVWVLIFKMLFSDSFLPNREFGAFVKRLTNFDIIAMNAKNNLYKFYGNKCGPNQVSSVLYRNNIDYNSKDWSLRMLLVNLALMRILSFLVLKIKVNMSFIELIFKKITNKIKINF